MYGFGASFVAAEHLALKLRRRGYRAHAAHSTGFRLADDLLDIERGEAVVVFAPGRLLTDSWVSSGHGMMGACRHRQWRDG